MAIAGKSGYIEVKINDSSKRIAEMANWSLDLGADNIDITSFDSDGWKEFLAGLKEWSGSAEGNFVENDGSVNINETPTDTYGHKQIINAWISGEAVEFTFVLSDSVQFVGEGFINLSLDVPVEDKASFSVDIQGSGKLTVPSV